MAESNPHRSRPQTSHNPNWNPRFHHPENEQQSPVPLLIPARPFHHRK
jgi:hypothetical protein